MFREIFQDFRPGRPHFVDLRWIFDKVPRHAGSAETRIFDVRKHSVKRVTEFVKSGADLIVGEQRRLAWGRFWDVEMVCDHRLGSEQFDLLNISDPPGD